MSASDYWDGSLPDSMFEGYEPTVYPKRTTCKYCNKTGLKWKVFGFMTYRLVSQKTGEIHICNNKQKE